MAQRIFPLTLQLATEGTWFFGKAKLLKRCMRIAVLALKAARAKKCPTVLPNVGAPLERGVRQHRIVARVRGNETREPALKTRLLDRGGMVELRQLRPV